MIAKVKIQGYRLFRDFTLEPRSQRNLIVGGNESGKSTLMEAISLALTGRVNGRRASEELNPYWFNTSLVADFVRQRQEGSRIALPEIRIELFFEDQPDLQDLCGAINTELPTFACPGVTLHVLPQPEYASEIEEWLKSPSHLLPVEYYAVDWRTFSDRVLTARPRQLTTAVIDSRTVRSYSGIDAHMRQILDDHLEPSERAALSVAYRGSSSDVSRKALEGVNSRLKLEQSTIHDRPISLAIDLRSSWEGAVVPHIDDVPFSMSGQGAQAALKIALAMSRSASTTTFVMVEEPENHLSHTSLNKLLARMNALAGSQQQLFITTHSSFVLNRLGLDALLLVGGSGVTRVSELSSETVSYFQKLPGHDTLRMVLANKVALVEGPSDEIIFERVYLDRFGARPIEAGIDIVCMRGLSLARCLELCSALDKPVAAIRDNDGVEPSELRQGLERWLYPGRRELFVGTPAHGTTLEPQIVQSNGEPKLRAMLGISPSADLLKWMSREKTEGALRIAQSLDSFIPPSYLLDAACFLHA